jgi:hypothetical protein
MKKNRLVAILIISNVLLLGLAGVLGILPRSATSPTVQSLANSQYQSASAPFNDGQKSMEPSEGVSEDAASGQAASPQSGDLQESHGGSVSLPLAYRESDPNTYLSKADPARTSLMRGTFIKAVAGIHQDPNDPQNTGRWQKTPGGGGQLLSNNSQVASEEPVSLPLAFLEPDAGANLSKEDQATLNTLRENFIKEIGGLYQNPNDPQYLSRWGEAESEADALYRIHMGETAYVKMLDTRQRQSWLQSP